MSLTKEEKERRLKERQQKKWNDTHKLINNIDHKLCSICEKYHPATEEYFYKSKSFDGLQPYCKKCAKEKSKINIEENRDRRNAYMRDWMKQPKPKEQTRERLKRLRSEGWQREWQRNNRDKLNVQQDFRKMHKEHEISPKEWLSCKDYFDNFCAYCGLSIDEHWVLYDGKLILGDFHKEHVAYDGSNKLDNCVPSCKECNCEKRQFDLDEWYNESNAKFNEERLVKINNWLQDDHKLYIEPSKPKQKYTKTHEKWFR